ncbi:MAG: ABC transporter permease [Bryobacteraceae bacterium]|jgi:predicted permease
MFSDFRFALRSLRRNPSFAAVAALSIALGIGANTAMFSLADAMLLRPVPVPHPSAVLNVRSQLRGRVPGSMSYPDYVDFRAKTRAFSGLTAYRLGTFGYAMDRQALPEMKAGLLVSGNFFNVLEVTPQLGRTFRPDEDAVPGRDAVTVIGHDLWQQDFGSAPDIVGRKILVDGIEFAIIGVAPESFTGIEQYFRPALYIPLMMAPRLASDDHNLLTSRDDRELAVKGRLRPGASAEQAAVEARVIASGLAQAYPATDRNWSAAVLSEFQSRVEQEPVDAMMARMLLLLAGVVLLIACANVANLTLSRGIARSGEIAVRLAIGAGRWRLVRQLLAESLLIAVAAGATGVFLAASIVQPFQHWRIPAQIPLEVNARMDTRVLLYSLGAALLSSLLFGLVPAIRATRADVATALKASGRTATSHRHFLGRNALVVAQIAGSLFLLVLATQLYRGVSRLLSAPAEFRSSHMLMASFDPQLVRYTDQQARDFYQRLVRDARQLPEATFAAVAELVPISNHLNDVAIVPEGYQLPNGRNSVTAWANVVGDGYFRTVDVPILQGRGFLETDTANSPRVAVVNQRFAETYWPNQNPIGKRFRVWGPEGDWVEVVGLAKMSKYIALAEPPMEFFYLPLSQNFRTQMTLLIATSGSSGSLAQPLRRLVKSIDPNQPVFAVSTMEEYFSDRATKVMGSLAAVVGGMGLLGLALALSGIYGVMSWAVARRRREIGIRMAIGADRTAVVGMILKRGVLLGAWGTAIGLVLSLWLGRAITASAFLVALDWRLAALVALVLLAMTLAGAYIPARRAARLDPNTVLREE